MFSIFKQQMYERMVSSIARGQQPERRRRVRRQTARQGTEFTHPDSLSTTSLQLQQQQSQGGQRQQQ